MFRLENVSKNYTRNGQTIGALHDASLEIEAGEFVAVVGPSGSGKSTILTLLGGMLTPTAGRVWFEECSLYDLSVQERARIRRQKMGFVFQSFNLVPYLSALENVEVALLLRGESRATQRRLASAMLGRFGLGERLKHRPSELSVGQQQRVALARALAHEPAVIMADEPTGNLDSATRDLVFECFDECHRSGKTIVMVTHDLQAAERGTRLLHLVNGRVSEGCSAAA